MGYTFNGGAPIAGLLKIEADALVLGELVEQGGQSPTTGDPVEQRKQEYRKRHREASDDLLERWKN